MSAVLALKDVVSSDAAAVSTTAGSPSSGTMEGDSIRGAFAAASLAAPLPCAVSAGLLAFSGWLLASMAVSRLVRSPIGNHVCLPIGYQAGSKSVVRPL